MIQILLYLQKFLFLLCYLRPNINFLGNSFLKQRKSQLTAAEWCAR